MSALTPIFRKADRRNKEGLKRTPRLSEQVKGTAARALIEPSWKECTKKSGSVFQAAPTLASVFLVDGAFRDLMLFIEIKTSDAVVPFSDSDNDAQDFIDELILMPHVRSIGQCIDVVFEKFNNLQNDGEFSRCDEAIESLLKKIDRIKPTLLVSFLVITLAAKSKLRLRATLYAAIEAALRKQFGEDRTRKILVGLK